MFEKRNQHSGTTVQLCSIAICLLAIVLLAPDAGHRLHRSFFVVAYQCTWGQWFNWQAAWCSIKIIFLSLAILLFLEAFAHLLLRRNYEVLGLVLITAGIVPGILAMFGTYELAKAVF